MSNMYVLAKFFVSTDMLSCLFFMYCTVFMNGVRFASRHKSSRNLQCVIFIAPQLAVNFFNYSRGLKNWKKNCVN